MAGVDGMVSWGMDGGEAVVVVEVDDADDADADDGLLPLVSLSLGDAAAAVTLPERFVLAFLDTRVEDVAMLPTSAAFDALSAEKREEDEDEGVHADLTPTTLALFPLLLSPAPANLCCISTRGDTEAAHAERCSAARALIWGSELGERERRKKREKRRFLSFFFLLQKSVEEK